MTFPTLIYLDSFIDPETFLSFTCLKLTPLQIPQTHADYYYYCFKVLQPFQRVTYLSPGQVCFSLSGLCLDLI